MTGSLLSCDRDTYQWVGSTRISLKGSPDIEKLLGLISRRWKDDGDFSMSTWVAEDKTPVLSIRSAFDAEYIVGTRKNGKQLKIASFSPCFILAKDQYPGEPY